MTAQDETAATPFEQVADVPLEVELKYAVDDPGPLVAALSGERLGSLEAGPWREVEVVDTYLDTADGRLADAGYGVRLRAVDGAVLVTVKSRERLGNDDTDENVRDGGATAALHRRREYEAPAAATTDVTAWPASEARELVRLIAEEGQLLERFQLRQRRRERELRAHDGFALLSMDEVGVSRDGVELGHFTNLEVELRDGSDRVLLELAEGLEATGLVAPESRSKEEIAEELVAEGGDGSRQRLELGDRPGEDAADADPGVDAAAADTEPIAREDGEFAAPHVDAAPARAPLPRTPGIRADDSFAAAGRKVIQLHFLRLQAREAGARSGESVEDVRKMRVATRRLRAAWRLFEDAYRPKRVRRAVRDLKRLATALGVVRDLDVLVAGLDGWTSAGGSDVKTAVSPFRDALLEERREGFAQLSRLMDEQVYQRFVEEHEAFLDATDATAGGQAPNEPTLVRETAPSRVWTAYERVRAHEAGIAWADVVALHALRIEVKRLRYTLEGFREVLGPETAWLIARLTALQDHLGALNDADVAAAKTRAFLLSRAPQLPTESREAIGRYLQLREREIARQRATIGPTWRPIVSPTFRRALGRAVSAL